MAVTEYTGEEVELTSGEYAIIVNGSICSEKIEDTSIFSPYKIVVGTESEIDSYIANNKITYEVIPLPEINE